VSDRLRPVRDDELASFEARAKAWYVASIEHEGGLPHDRAVDKAERDFAALWSDGRPVPGQLVFIVEDADGVAVGDLWLAERDLDGRRVLWVYDLAILPEHRGRGHGRAAMLLAEEEARARGVDFVGLNVFGGNEVARGLYQSLGYQEMAVSMVKQVA
jgi:ribosomal protein S18 acetylase RimI-like enzyme